ncbi:MAG: FtsX-like permease family protein [Bacteroidia bacterium]|nr:FtsX-like permease family protein [Bacteroidia bacterium]
MSWISFLAIRYLPLKGKKQSIQWITRISFLAVSVITACAIIIQSVMNGLTSLVVGLYNSLEPDIKIEHIEKKYFLKDSFPFKKIKFFKGIHYSEIFEKKVLLRNYEKTFYTNAVFCNDNYFRILPFDTIVKEGTPITKGNFFIIGKSLADVLGTHTEMAFDLVEIMAPSNSDFHEDLLSANSDFFNTVELKPTGIFFLNEELDLSRIYLSKKNMFELFEDSLSLSAVHIKITDTKGQDLVQELKKILGPQWKITTKEESNHALIKTLNSEKQITAYILWFILFIALFTIIGSLTMIILEKKKDIFILYSLGADIHQIKMIFVLEGIIITLAGGITGLLLGLIFCWIQYRFHFVPFGDEFVINYYPVEIRGNDVFQTLLAILVMSTLAGLYPVGNFISKEKLQYSQNK